MLRGSLFSFAKQNTRSAFMLRLSRSWELLHHTHPAMAQHRATSPPRFGIVTRPYLFFFSLLVYIPTLHRSSWEGKRPSHLASIHCLSHYETKLNPPRASTCVIPSPWSPLCRPSSKKKNSLVHQTFSLIPLLLAFLLCNVVTLFP